MRGRALVPVAEELIRRDPGTEAEIRTAVSRAYYAAFSELDEYLRSHHYKPSNRKRLHDAPWLYLRDCLVDADVELQARGRAVADTGIRLKARRHKADYRLSLRLDRDEASVAVHEAKRIIRELDALDAAQPSALP